MFDVAEEAPVVLIGAILSGKGELYFADLDVAVVEPTRPSRSSLDDGTAP